MDNKTFFLASGIIFGLLALIGLITGIDVTLPIILTAICDATVTIITEIRERR